jgi:hypothetical protein
LSKVFHETADHVGRISDFLRQFHELVLFPQYWKGSKLRRVEPGRAARNPSKKDRSA